MLCRLQVCCWRCRDGVRIWGGEGLEPVLVLIRQSKKMRHTSDVLSGEAMTSGYGSHVPPPVKVASCVLSFLSPSPCSPVLGWCSARQAWMLHPFSLPLLPSAAGLNEKCLATGFCV